MNDTTHITDPFIWIKDDVLTNDFCQDTIERFKTSNAKRAGATGGGVLENVKRSTDVMLSELPDWKDVDAKLAEAVGRYTNEYTATLYSKFNITNHFTNGKEHMECLSPFTRHYGDLWHDSGYQMQETTPEQGYVWHNDFLITATHGIRKLTFIFYINDVEEGWTEFIDGQRVQPKTGRMLIFPASWTYVHRGCPPKSTKYIITGWLYESTEKGFITGVN